MKVNLGLSQTRGFQAQNNTSITFSGRDLSLPKTPFEKTYQAALRTGDVRKMRDMLKELAGTNGSNAPETRGVRAAISEAVGEND